jgi:hypothetical protein
MEDKETHTKFWSENLKKKKIVCGGTGVHGTVILRHQLGAGVVNWIYRAEGRIQQRDVWNEVRTCKLRNRTAIY